jgi:Tfp pilus assembly protein PilN
VRPVNLIPPEERRGERMPARTGPLAYIVVGVLAAALLGVSAVVLTGNQISDRKSELSGLQGQEASLTQQADRLSSYADFAALEQARVQTVTTLAQSRFDWERVLRELAVVIPDDVWLTSLSGKVSADDSSGSSTTSPTGGGVSPSSIAGPSLDMNGCAASHDAVARFAASLKDIDGVTRVVIDSSSRSSESDSAGTTSGASTAGTGATSDCGVRQFIATFEITVAFDDVQSLAAAAGAAPAPPAGTAPTTPASAADQSQVSSAQQQEDQQKQSIQQQTQKGRNAVSNIVPGAVLP